LIVQTNSHLSSQIKQEVQEIHDKEVGTKMLEKLNYFASHSYITVYLSTEQTIHHYGYDNLSLANLL